MHRAQLDAPAEQQPGDALRLRARVGVVEAPRDAALEHVEMLGQHDARLHHVQVVDPAAVDFRERGGQQVGLLLVVPFQADPVARAQYRLEQRGGILGRHPLAAREMRACREARVACLLRLIPCRHCVSPAMRIRSWRRL